MPKTQTISTPWTGRWCWTIAHLTRPWNTYVYGRRTVDLPGKPRRAVVRISADARYILFVNGQRIHQGPARSFPQTQSFDVLDIADALRPGRNAICVIVHQFGVPTFFSVYRDASGLLVDGVIECEGGTVPIHTPAGWMFREAMAWRRDVVKLSQQLGFQEHFDADAEPAGWLTPEYEATEESGWKLPIDRGPVGAWPWLSMEQRGAPLLADHVEPFKAVTAQFGGENARGYKITDNVYALPLTEPRKKDRSLLEKPQAMLKDDAEVTTVPPPEDGTFAMAVLDFGQVGTGHIILDIAEAAGDEIIDIVYTEDVDKAGAPLLAESGQNTSQIAMADRYRCRAGTQRWEPFHYKAFRYATLIFRNVDKPLKVRHVALRQVRAALEPAGSFECSDERLTAIWSAAQLTLANCMFDAYVDCPGREQAQWWGDARVQFRVNQYAYGDVSLLQRGIRQVAQSQGPDGSLHAHPPSDVPWHRLPDYMLTWVGSLWDHHFHTGRTELLRECLPAMQRLFEFFAAHELREGLIGDFDGFWVFLDRQAGLHKSNFSALLNLMYLRALRWGAAICGVMNETACADAYDTKAATLEQSIEKHFFDAAAKVWRDGFDPKSETMVDVVSQHANALAILLKIKPETHTHIAENVLLKGAGSRRGKILGASPFFYAYVLEALVAAGRRQEAVDLIRDKWGAMLDAGATTLWEHWEVTHESRCHAWSSSPLYHLSQQVLGVTPMKAGWKQVRIAPLPGEMEHARGEVPTPLGVIHVEWEKAGEDQLVVRIDLPEGIAAEFVSPVGEVRTLDAGVHQFHT